MSTPVRARDNVFSRREIEGMLADGKLIIIVDGNVLRLDSWIKYHPGGDMAIKHMIGKDATDEVNAWVSPNLSILVQFDLRIILIPSSKTPFTGSPSAHE